MIWHISFFLFTLLFFAYCIWLCHKPKTIGMINIVSARGFVAGDIITTGIPSYQYLIRRVHSSTALECEKVEGMLALTINIKARIRKQWKQLKNLLK